MTIKVNFEQEIQYFVEQLRGKRIIKADAQYGGFFISTMKKTMTQLFDKAFCNVLNHLKSCAYLVISPGQVMKQKGAEA